MSKHIMVTVGTSIFTNILEGDHYNDKYDRLCNSSFNNVEKTRRRNEDLFEEVLKKAGSNPEASAEIKSITKIAQRINGIDAKVHLLFSETNEAALATEIISELLNSMNPTFTITKQMIKGLKIDNSHDFENIALNNLYDYFHKLTAKKKDKPSVSYDDICINITGGYKAIIPYMTLLGQLYNIPVYYIYEKSEELLEVPQLPVQFDQLIAEKYYPILSENFIPNNIKDDIKKELNDLKLIRKSNDGYKKTAMGNLFVNYVEREMPVAKSVLGFLVEMKLLEFYVKEHYLDHKKKKYQEVEHSVEDEQLANNELDIFFKKVKDNEPRGNNHFVVGEVKGLMALSDRNFDPENKNKKGLKQQFENQLNGLRYKLAFNDRKKNFQEYHLFIHIYEDSKKEPNKKNLKEMQSILKQYFPDCQFRASKVYVDINPFMEFRNGVKKVNPYSNYMHKKLTANDIKEIKNI